MSVTIWHNPRCSKSRETLALLRERGIEPEVVEYLKTPPSEVAIRTALAALAIEARDLARTNEAVFRELGLSPDAEPERLIGAMAANPVLIQRPVVMTPTGARIGRPPEAVLEIL